MRHGGLLVSFVVFIVFNCSAYAQFSNSRPISPPPLPGPSALQQAADAFMAGNGYRLPPNRTAYGSFSGYSPSSLTTPLAPGRWAIALLDRSGETCAPDVSYRALGYTIGPERRDVDQGPGFQFIPLTVEKQTDISITVRDGNFKQGDRTRQCGYELRVYLFAEDDRRSVQPGARSQQSRCRACENWDDRQQRCVQWRQCY